MSEHRPPRSPDQPPERGSDRPSDRPPVRRRRMATRKAKPRRSPGRKRRAGRLWLLFLLGVIAVGAGGWLLLREKGLPSFLPEETATIERQPAPLSGDRAVVLVFPEWDAMGYVAEQRQIPSRLRADEDLLTLMESLCAGPEFSGAMSAIPAGTRALAAFYDPQNKSVVLDFSVELVTRHPGGSAAEAATMTSILRTVALNFPEATSCLILVDGAQVETLKGHLNLDQPLDPRRWL